ncbi:MAG: hypothetical protein AAF628_28895 [Planctomycetota bacterium]
MTDARRPRSHGWRLLWWSLAIASGALAAAVLPVVVQVQRAAARGQQLYADVFVQDARGVIRQVSPGDGVYQFPHIHPSGTRVAFCGGATGVVRLFEHDLTTGTTRALTDGSYGAVMPHYAPDGRTLVFMADVGTGQPPLRVRQIPRRGTFGRQRFRLCRLELATGKVRALTDPSANDLRPAFHPEGREIVFTSTRGGKLALWTVRADGTAPPAPLRYRGFGYNASYAADGTALFFHANDGGRHRACRLNLGDEQPTFLANDLFQQTHGACALPDGCGLLVHAQTDAGWSLWELPLDGSAARRRTPPDFPHAMHASCAGNGALAFDEERPVSVRRELWWRLRRLGRT